jgi:hypothetical protein
MMMKMLNAGGMGTLTDSIRGADEDNINGYYELEKIKRLKEDTSFLEDAVGRSVKIVSALLKYLPSKYQYKIIFMRRNLDQVLSSQKEMLIRRGEPTDRVSDEKMKEVYLKHLKLIEGWLEEQENIKVVYLNYKDFFVEPKKHIKVINKFLGNSLDTDKIYSVIDQTLYRQRH